MLWVAQRIKSNKLQPFHVFHIIAFLLLLLPIHQDDECLLWIVYWKRASSLVAAAAFFQWLSCKRNLFSFSFYNNWYSKKVAIKLQDEWRELSIVAIIMDWLLYCTKLLEAIIIKGAEEMIIERDFKEARNCGRITNCNEVTETRKAAAACTKMISN